MASIFLTKQAFDKIDSLPQSIEYKILSKQTKIYLDLPQKDLVDLLCPVLDEDGQFVSNNILDFQNDFQNVKFVSGKDIFDSVRANNYAPLLNIPDGIFVLGVQEATATKIKEGYGVICMPENKVDFSVLTKSHTVYCEREITKPHIDIDSKNKPRHYNISQIFPSGALTPCNTIVVIDKYLFKDDSEGKCIVEILKQLIPKTLSSEICHVLIIFELEDSSIDARKERFKKVTEEITTKISQIHGKSVSVEFVAGIKRSELFEDMHNRNIITNYEIISAEHAFGLYNKHGKMMYDQKITIQALYSDGMDGQSQSPEHGQKYILKKARNIIEYAKERFEKDYPRQKEEKDKLGAFHEPQYRFSQCGKLNPCKVGPKDIKNRLIIF